MEELYLKHEKKMEAWDVEPETVRVPNRGVLGAPLAGGLAGRGNEWMNEQTKEGLT